MEIVKTVIEIAQGKRTWNQKRSKLWPKIRDMFIKKYRKCAICGGSKKLEVHHKKPFHLYPELELDNNNLVVLCENKKYGANCHLLFGHLGNYKRYNPNIDEDIILWNSKLKLNKKDNNQLLLFED